MKRPRGYAHKWTKSNTQMEITKNPPSPNILHNAATFTPCTIYTSNSVTKLTDLDSWEVFAQASAVKKTYSDG